MFWGFVASMYVGNLMLLALNLPLVSVFVTVLRIPYAYLYPLIIMFCIIGVYEVNNSIVDVWIMLIMGVLGYALRKFEFDPAPLVLGLVISPILEQSLRQSLIMSNGNYLIFFSRPISAGLLIVSIVPAAAVGLCLRAQARGLARQARRSGSGRTLGLDMKNLTIDPERLWDDLMETAKIGGTAEGRHLPADADRSRPRGARLVQGAREALGCTVTVDDMGAMFARRPGQRSDIPPIAMGSHLDTQPTGGKFDGALGVLAALEALSKPAPRRLRDLRADRGRQLDQRGRLALYPGDDRLRRLCRRLQARLGQRAHRSRRRELRRGAGQDRLSRTGEVAAAISCRPFSRCTSSKGPFSKPRARTSASSPACRPCAGTR